MTTSVLPRILCVDDEQHVLDGLARTLRSDFNMTTALGGALALDKIHSEGPFAVIMSDMRMPGMDGVAFLTQAAHLAPDSVRVLLTGQADLDSAVAVVNRGRIFRFLLKPADHEQLSVALHDSVAQHELIVAEKILLERTLRGAVAALLETLSLANPLAFARATRIRRIVTALLPAVDPPDGWSVEVAASLSQLGAVALPTEVITKLDSGTALTPTEQALVDRVPALTDQLLEAIPRLDGVRESIRLQTKHFDGTGVPNTRIAGEAIPLAARLLRVAIDLDQLESLGFDRAEAIGAMAERHGVYDPRLVRALQGLVELEQLNADQVPRHVAVEDLQSGMVIARDVKDANGVLLVGRGHEVTASLVARIHNIADRITQPIWVTGAVHVST